MKLHHIQTNQLAHWVALWMLINALICLGWFGHIDDGHWVAVFSDARIHPIPPFAWLVALLPTLITVTGSLIVLGRNDKTGSAAIEGICANLVGIGLLLYLLVAWCINGL